MHRIYLDNAATTALDPSVIEVMVESMKNNSPVVFLFHPNELIPHRQKTIYRRSKNFFGFLLKDYLRKHIKSRNLGKNCFYILEEMIKNFKKKGFEFLTVRSYYEKIKGNSF